MLARPGYPGATASAQSGAAAPMPNSVDPPGWESARALRVSTAQESSAGKRPSNEDSMGLLVPEDPRTLSHKGIALVISDGVSSAEAGREAAEVCVNAFLGDYFSTPETWTVETSTRKVLSALNGWLHRKSSRFTDAIRGYVCTLSILVLKARSAHVFHVGDTRIWLYRGGKLQQLTHDHATRVSDTETYLARAMGMDSKVDVDFTSLPVEVGDLFLLTTDGIHGSLDAVALAEILSGERPLDESCRLLIDEALRRGSTDNATCQLVRLESVPDADADAYVTRLQSLPFPPPLEPGWVLDGFTVEREIYASSRSQCYLVRARDGRALVMKTPSVNYEDDPRYVERFILEQWVGRRVESRHLIKSVDPPDDRSCLYNLMEVVEGIPLSEWMRRRRGRLPKEMSEVVAITAQIVRGLIALHRRQILHQDIKPDNVLIDGDGNVTIIDYGSCRVAGIEELASPIERDVALGTRSYSAPEFTLGLRAAASADLYSLGCLTYELLTGRLPYGDAAEGARTRADFEALRYAPASSINPHVPVWADAALEKAVQVDVRRRYGELTEFLYDLEHPNPEFLRKPFVEGRDGQARWRRAALGLLALLLLSWAYFLGRG